MGHAYSPPFFISFQLCCRERKKPDMTCSYEKLSPASSSSEFNCWSSSGCVAGLNRYVFRLLSWYWSRLWTFSFPKLLTYSQPFKTPRSRNLWESFFSKKYAEQSSTTSTSFFLSSPLKAHFMWPLTTAKRWQQATVEAPSRVVMVHHIWQRSTNERKKRG